MAPKYKKITYGFVIQIFGADDKCISQEFVAGDEVEYEDMRGNPIPEENEEYHPFDMEQPRKEGDD